MRKGSARVSECEAPLLSVSGATTHTSSVRSVAIFSSTSRPGASMPSSLVIRMRISRGGGDLGRAAHIRLQRFGDAHAAVSLLVVFQHRDQSAADGDARAVQRVYEAGFLGALRLVACVHAAGLEVP